MRIAVVGQGYVGLTAAACLAQSGHKVVGIESETGRLESLRRGKVPFYEPGLQEILDTVVPPGGLAFGESLACTAAAVDAVIVAVGSPQLPSGGTDLRDLASAMGEILAVRHLPEIIMVKSTIPPGTSERLLAQTPEAARFAERYVYSPEFLAQGSAVTGWRKPSRIVVGLRTERLLPTLRDIYRSIDGPWVVTTPTNAEMIKYASNAFLATKISFINEIANLCDGVGASIDDVAAGLRLDPRIGTAFLGAGVGYGGSCFPKDTHALIHLSGLEGHSMPLLEAVVAVNKSQRLRMVRIVRDHIEDRPNAVVAVLGLSFKPGTDDLRDAPSLTVIQELLGLGVQVRAWDPVVPDDAVERWLPRLDRCPTVEGAARGSNAVVILTEWPEVVLADWGTIAESMAQPRLVVDGRNCLNPADIRSSGLAYRGIGRGLA